MNRGGSKTLSSLFGNLYDIGTVASIVAAADGRQDDVEVRYEIKTAAINKETISLEYCSKDNSSKILHRCKYLGYNSRPEMEKSEFLLSCVL